MRMIYCDLMGSYFTYEIVDAEPLKKMWKINSCETATYFPSKTVSRKLIPFTQERWDEIFDIKKQYDYLWQRRMALRKFTVEEEQS